MVLFVVGGDADIDCVVADADVIDSAFVVVGAYEKGEDL